MRALQRSHPRASECVFQSESAEFSNDMPVVRRGGVETLHVLHSAASSASGHIPLPSVTERSSLGEARGKAFFEAAASSSGSPASDKSPSTGSYVSDDLNTPEGLPCNGGGDLEGGGDHNRGNHDGENHSSSASALGECLPPRVAASEASHFEEGGEFAASSPAALQP
ncbi:hypothetical protein cyc_09189, partial [Cyclospora cayetanensis]